MKYYFKSNYDEVAGYSMGWYGILDYAPSATIILYDDNNNMAIGYIEDNMSGYNQLLSLYPSTITGYVDESAAMIDFNLLAIDDPNVWFGDRLMHRWDEDPGGDEEEEGEGL